MSGILECSEPVDNPRPALLITMNTEKKNPAGREEFLQAMEDKMAELGWPKGTQEVVHEFVHLNSRYRIVLEKRDFPCGLSVRTTMQKFNGTDWVKVAGSMIYL